MRPIVAFQLKLYCGTAKNRVWEAFSILVVEVFSICLSQEKKLLQFGVLRGFFLIVRPSVLQ